MNDNDYVGVDEKYKPKNEGQSDMDKEKEENNKRVKKVGKFVLGGFLFWMLLFFGIVIASMIFMFLKFNNMKDFGKGILNDVKEKQQIVLDEATAKQQEMINEAIEKQEEKSNEAIEKQEELKSDYDKLEYNSQFEMYIGTQKGFVVKTLIDNIIQNNKTNKDKIVTVVFENKEIYDADDIIDIKSKITNTTDYEVIADYNDGYINKINIR